MGGDRAKFLCLDKRERCQGKARVKESKPCKGRTDSDFETGN